MTAYGWAELEQEAPKLAAAVRACFAVRKHCTMATLRADGSPRISGTEVQWEGGALWVGSMPGARKARDLQRDGRVAVHSPTVDPPEGEESSWAGEAKVAGIAVEVGVESDAAPGPEPDSHRFRIDLTEVVHTRVEGDGLLITSWHPGRGVQERRRK
ncbi:MAG: pyridoxamine 5'-phosphate oxidase family protein [Actinobacteria bacterium]|nr:pyridoxamine 5'-phosphate oxidase family protein [Actinomycetota bacterium]